MDIGEDTGTPVVEDYAAKMPYRFTGTLNKFTIHLDNQSTEKLTENDERILNEANRKVSEARD
ncbi:hypothetical protein D3C87_1836330 [compost metagenome]